MNIQTPASVRARAADAVRIPAIGPAGELFPIDKLKAHRDGTQHLAVSVFVFDGDKLLIQRRAPFKYHCALQWANTCCSHPNWGESLADAARRRLREELGIDLSLTECATLDYRAEVTSGLIENERVCIYRADVDRTTLHLAPDRDEVCETRWITLGALRAAMALSPDDYAPWFRIYIARWNELGFDIVPAPG